MPTLDWNTLNGLLQNASSITDTHYIFDGLGQVLQKDLESFIPHVDSLAPADYYSHSRAILRFKMALDLLVISVEEITFDHIPQHIFELIIKMLSHDGEQKPLLTQLKLLLRSEKNDTLRTLVYTPKWAQPTADCDDDVFILTQAPDTDQSRNSVLDHETMFVFNYSPDSEITRYTPNLFLDTTQMITFNTPISDALDGDDTSPLSPLDETIILTTSPPIFSPQRHLEIEIADDDEDDYKIGAEVDFNSEEDISPPSPISLGPMVFRTIAERERHYFNIYNDTIFRIEKYLVSALKDDNLASALLQHWPGLWEFKPDKKGNKNLDTNLAPPQFDNYPILEQALRIYFRILTEICRYHHFQWQMLVAHSPRNNIFSREHLGLSKTQPQTIIKTFYERWRGGTQVETAKLTAQFADVPSVEFRAQHYKLLYEDAAKYARQVVTLQKFVAHNRGQEIAAVMNEQAFGNPATPPQASPVHLLSQMTFFKGMSPRRVDLPDVAAFNRVDSFDINISPLNLAQIMHR